MISDHQDEGRDQGHHGKRTDDLIRLVVRHSRGRDSTPALLDQVPHGCPELLRGRRRIVRAGDAAGGRDEHRRRPCPVRAPDPGPRACPPARRFPGSKRPSPASARAAGRDAGAPSPRPRRRRRRAPSHRPALRRSPPPGPPAPRGAAARPAARPEDGPRRGSKSARAGRPRRPHPRAASTSTSIASSPSSGFAVKASASQAADRAPGRLGLARPAPGRRPSRSPARRPACRPPPPGGRRAAPRRRPRASARQPGAPSRSKQASCGFTATQAGPAISIRRAAVLEDGRGGAVR